MNRIQQEQYDSLRGLIAARVSDYKAAALRQFRVWEGTQQPEGELPLLLHVSSPEPYASFIRYTPSEVHYDKDKMLLNGMLDMAGVTLAEMQAVPSIRANMGCGILPSMFPGIKARLFDDAKMPWIVDHLSKERIAGLDDGDIGITDEFKLALEHIANIAEKIEGTGAYVYPLDIQGPFDIAHLVYGDPIFYDLYDDPPFIRHLMDLSCVAIEKGFDECLKLIPHSDEIVTHYNSLAIPRSLGGIKLSEDTSTLICDEHLDEYVMPSSIRVLKHAGGGYIHYCGKHEGLFKRFLDVPEVCGINFGNPDFHDMDDILRRVANAGKVYYGTSCPKNGESRADYFARSIRAATGEDGICRLLLQCGAPYDERDAVRADWESAASI